MKALYGLDDHGQPLNRLLNHKRLSDRTVDELIGLSKGVLADSKLVQSEVEFLQDWMKQNIRYTQDRIINTLYSRIKEMLSDDFLDDEETRELIGLLKSITGEQLPENKIESSVASFPLTVPPPEIVFRDKMFCLTGKFAYGPRRICVDAIKRLGGDWRNDVSGITDYLVIGNLSSTDWIHTSFGRKIERAVGLKETKKNSSIQIVHEDHWAKFAFE